MLTFLSDKFFGVIDLFKSNKKITAQEINHISLEFKKILLESDVPLEIAEYFKKNLEDRCLGQEITKKLNAQEFLTKHISEALIDLLHPKGAFTPKKDFQSEWLENTPSKYKTIFIAGLQGAGKTTTCGKLVFNLIHNEEPKNKAIKKEILIISIDFYRPAARDQLRILANKLEVDFFESKTENVLLFLKEALLYAKENKKYFTFIDTAGRMHIDEKMMSELKNAYNLTSPDLTFLVLDGMMGQYALEVAKEFNKIVSFDAAIISKLDSDAKGGAALSFAYEIKKPIAYIGNGEKLENLDDFSPKRIAGKMLGKGDLNGFLKNAEKKITAAENEIMEEAIKRKDLSFESYIKIFQALDQFGPLKQMFSMMPKSLVNTMDDSKVNQIEDMIKQTKAMANSMTPKEKKFPVLLANNVSRMNRIAKGSGLKIENIKNLLEMYNKSKSSFQGLAKMGFFK